MEKTEKNNSQLITIKLGNQDFELIRELRSVKDLKLDPFNQRISFKIKQSGLPQTDNELHKILWEFDAVKDLYQSVYQNGGLIEDPIIRDDNKVIEGNCRTVVLRELHKKYPHDTRFSKVYVRILPKDVTEEQLMLLLGELHIAGKIDWRAYEQAEYVYKMNKQFGKSYDYLASHLRWSRSKLSQKIFAYEETTNYLQNFSDPEGINKFSYFEEFMKKSALREKKDNDQNFIKEFSRWVYEKKLKEAKDVRYLPEIISSQEAYNTFLKYGLDKAKEVLFSKNPSLVSNLYYSIDATTQELNSIALSEIESIKNNDEAKVIKLKQLKSALQKLESYIGFKF